YKLTPLRALLSESFVIGIYDTINFKHISFIDIDYINSVKCFAKYNNTFVFLCDNCSCSDDLSYDIFIFSIKTKKCIKKYKFTINKPKLDEIYQLVLIDCVSQTVNNKLYFSYCQVL